jgi:PAS domain S-box-containing protein
MYGYAKEDFIGRTPEFLSPPGRNDAAAAQAAIRRAFEGETQQFDWWGQRKNGEVFPMEVRLKKGTYFGHTVVFATGRDLTLRHQAEAALITERELLRTLIDLLPDFIFVKDTESRFLVVNDALAKAYCQQPATMIGQTDADFLPKALASHFRASELKVLAGETYSAWEDTITLPDNHTRRVLTYMAAFRNGNGGVGGLVGIGRDITHQVRVEEQLRQSQKMEGIGRLAGGVAHDFNNILAVIRMQTDLLRMVGTLDEEQQGCLNEIEQAAERATNLTRQMLFFSRRKAIQAQDADLNEIVHDITKMLKRIIGEDIKTVVHCSTSPLHIHADPGMIDQLLLNLCVNSRDAMPDGGRIHIETAAVSLCEESIGTNPAARPGDFACLTVMDNGSGIAPENLPRIFDPFFTTKDVGKGTGLGLATVFGIVQQHKGWIDVSSTPRVGTTFHVYFPLVRAVQPAAPESHDAAPPVQGSGEAILVVEDEAPLRNLILNVLKRLGYRMFEASSAVEALRIWDENGEGIDLVLTDLVMPDGMGGVELLKRLREKRPRLKAICMSGYSKEVAGGEFEFSEGVDFLSKPFHMRQLTDIIRARLADPVAT